MHRAVRTATLSGGTLLLALTVGVAGCGKDSTGPSAAKEVRMNITATITAISDPDNLLLGNFSVDDEITGYYIYDSTLEDDSALETVGDYWHETSPYGMFLTCNSFEFKTDLSDVSYLLEIVNDHGDPAVDHYVMHSYNNVALSFSLSVDLISWQLDDDTAQAVDSTEPGTSPPVLTDWDSPFGLSIVGYDLGDPSSEYLIRAEVTECTKQGG